MQKRKVSCGDNKVINLGTMTEREIEPQCLHALSECHRSTCSSTQPKYIRRKKSTQCLQPITNRAQCFTLPEEGAFFKHRTMVVSAAIVVSKEATCGSPSMPSYTDLAPGTSMKLCEAKRNFIHKNMSFSLSNFNVQVK